MLAWAHAHCSTHPAFAVAMIRRLHLPKKAAKKVAESLRATEALYAWSEWLRQLPRGAKNEGDNFWGEIARIKMSRNMTNPILYDKVAFHLSYWRNLGVKAFPA